MKTSVWLIAICLLSACSQEGGARETGIKVYKAEFGDKWPFTVEAGVVDCVRGGGAIFRSNGQTYQLNGTASHMGYQPVNPIWRDNPEINGLKIDIGPMIDLALKQCS